ncbi:MAG: hypothetical protein OSB47_10675, partial [Pirellulaceae bacterium]|nr:hypothetical protein [Pirellulaceae bacterium]
MLQRKLTLWTVCLLSLFFFNTSAQAIDISEVVITADNAFRFGWGDVNQIPSNAGQIFPGVFESKANQIFQNGAETYFSGTPQTVTVDDYFYIIAHSDEATTQGVIAEVKALAPFKSV